MSVVPDTPVSGKFILINIIEDQCVLEISPHFEACFRVFI